MPDGRAVYEALQAGDKVGEVEIAITDTLVDAYAEAVGDSDALFMEADASGQRTAHPELLPKYAMEYLWVPLFNRMPNIRAKQAYDYIAPVKTGRTYRATGHVAEKYERRGRYFVVLEAVFKDEDGHEVLKDRRTQLVLTEEQTIKS